MISVFLSAAKCWTISIEDIDNTLQILQWSVSCKEIVDLSIMCCWSCVEMFRDQGLTAPFVEAAWRILLKHTNKLTVLFCKSVTNGHCREVESRRCQDDHGGGSYDKACKNEWFEEEQEEEEKAQSKEEDECGFTKKEKNTVYCLLPMLFMMPAIVMPPRSSKALDQKY